MASRADQSQPYDSDEPSGDRPPVATSTDKDVFEHLIERDLAICDNCFARRRITVDHFRSSGGRATGSAKLDDRTADLFCTECHAGTGESTLYRPHKGEWDDEKEEWDTPSGKRAVDYSNVHCHLSASYLGDMGGTVGREWSVDDPLAKNGEQVSLFRNLMRLRDRLEELDCDVPWEDWKRDAAYFKDTYPRSDRSIFARLVADTAPEHLTPDE